MTRRCLGMLMAVAFGLVLLIGCDDGDRPRDSDGDGLSDSEEALWGTSTGLSDTDGDGFSDYYEIVDLGFDPAVSDYGEFNPLVADLPDIRISLKSPPTIAIDLTTAESGADTFETTRSAGSSSTVTKSNTTTHTTAVEQTHSVEASMGFSGYKLEGSVTYGYSYTTSEENSFSYTAEQAQENSVTYGDAHAREESETVTASGGSLWVLLDVENRSSFAVEVSNIILSVVETSPQLPYALLPVGNLTRDIPWTSDPGNVLSQPGMGTNIASDVNYVNDSLDLATAMRLVRDSNPLRISVASYNVSYYGLDSTVVLTEVGNRTALVMIDYGPCIQPTDRRPELLRVAMNSFGGPPLTMGTILQDVLHHAKGATPVGYDTGEIDWTGGDPRTGLVRVKDVSADPSDPDQGVWCIVHYYRIQSEEYYDFYDMTKESYDFDGISVGVGNVVHLVYVVDEDHDGLCARQEFELGTSDTIEDSDGDGVSDYDEVSGYDVGGVTVYTEPTDADTDGDGLTEGEEVAGWDVTVNGGAAYHVTSDPTKPDTDGDGLTDQEESVQQTDPRLVDSDGDGLTDPEELAGWSVAVQGSTPYVIDSDPSEADTDSDGLSDNDEKAIGTDPRLADTDLDGLADALELSGWDATWQAFRDGALEDSGTYPGVTSDPLDPDTDDDGASDGAEYAATTHPGLADTDGDTFTDGEEMAPQGAIGTPIGEPDPCVKDARPCLLDIAVMYSYYATYDIGGETFYGLYQDLSEDAGGSWLNLCYRPGYDDDPDGVLTQIYTLNASDGEGDTWGGTVVQTDLNAGNDGDYIYLMRKREPLRQAVIDGYWPIQRVTVYDSTDGDSKSGGVGAGPNDYRTSCNLGFWQDTNEGAGGNSIFIGVNRGIVRLSGTFAEAATVLKNHGYPTYVATGTLTVPAGGSLAIDPGPQGTYDHDSVIKFAPGAQLVVDGQLVTSGYTQFTSLADDDPSRGDTNGDGASTGAAGDWVGITSAMDGAVIAIQGSQLRYATTGVYNDDDAAEPQSAISVTNSTITDCTGYGVDYDADSTVTLSGNTYTNCALGGENSH